MDATDKLKFHINIEELLNYYGFDDPKEEGDFIRSCCAIHGGKNPTSFVINKETGLYYCHAQCGGGDVYTMIQTIEDIGFQESVGRLAVILDVDIKDLDVKERTERNMKELREWEAFMRGQVVKPAMEPYVLNTPKLSKVTKYLNFEKETLELFELGHVSEITLVKNGGGDYKLSNRLVLPIYQDGEMIGASLRRMKPKDYPKWTHQPNELKVGSILYNYDNVKTQPIITIVEGITDVWAYHEIGIPSVCTFGANLSDEQYKMLMRTGAEIVISYDGDTAGREGTRKIIKKLFNKTNVYDVVMGEKDDPASIEREALKIQYESRKRLC